MARSTKSAPPAPPTPAGSSRASPSALLSRVRRSAGERSFSAFCRTYLQAHFRDKPSPMHLEVGALLEAACVPGGRGTRLAIAAPRGHAKSTLVSLGYVLWCALYGREPYILMLSHTIDQARDLLSHIKAELTGNPLLQDDFPESCAPERLQFLRWRRDEIILPGAPAAGAGPGSRGVKITALGSDTKIRGRRHRDQRPTLIIADDLENESEVRSAEQRQHKREWFERAVLQAGTAETNFIVVGTVLHYDSLLARLIDPRLSPGWSSRRYQAVTIWAVRKDLWETWEQVYTHRAEHEGRGGPGAARAFFDANRDAMLEGARALWPEREPYEALMEKRLTDGRAVFDAEKQNEPLHPEACLFFETDLLFWDDSYTSEDDLLADLGKHGSFYGACDPSLGRVGRGGDDSAIITLFRHEPTGTLYVLDADIRKRKPDQTIEAIIELQRRRRYAAFAFETNQFQEFMSTELKKRSALAGVNVPVNDVHHSTDKLGRVQSLQPLVTSGGLRFSRRHTVLLEQLRQFPLGAHDDGPDALHMAVEVARRPPGGIMVGPGPLDPWTMEDGWDDDRYGWKPVGHGWRPIGC